MVYNETDIIARETQTSKLLDLRNKYVSKSLGGNTVGTPPQLFVRKAKGVTIWDTEGTPYLDFGGGGGALNSGHCPESVVEAIKDQAEKYLHTCFGIIMYEPYVQYAQNLVESYPGNFEKKCIFSSSGAESVENAVKIARSYSKKPGILTFENGYHGRTLLTMSLSTKLAPLKIDQGPSVENITKVPYPYCYRCPNRLDSAKGECCATDFIRDIFDRSDSIVEIGAMIFEAVQGGGGVIVPPEKFIRELRKICDEKGIVLIDDEVLCGAGRTGLMWAVEHFDVVPDIMCCAKSIGGGLPLGATMGKKDIMDSPAYGSIGSTFGGNPLSCVAGAKAFDLIKNLLARGREIGNIMIKRLTEMQEKYEVIGDVRGKGPMVGIELVKDRNTKVPAVKETQQFVEKSWKDGVIVLGGGIHDNVIALFPPLVITNEELNSGLDVFESSFQYLRDKA